MKKMGARILTALLTVTMLFSVVACKDTKSGDGDNKEYVLVGPSACTVAEGYAAFSTDMFRVNGTGGDDFVSFQAESEQNIVFNDATCALDVAEGLKKGVYTVELTAFVDTESGQEVLTHTFTLTVALPEIPAGAPRIAGTAYGAVQKGYAAFSTDRFTLSGTGVTVNVSGVSKNGAAYETNAFAWNAAERTLDIAAGLACGQYAVTLTASNTVEEDEDFDFVYVFTVNDPVMPVIEGPESVKIGEGYSQAKIDGFLVLGTGARLTVQATKTADGSPVSGISYAAAQSALTVAAGLAAGEYSVKMRLTNGDVAKDATHTLTLTVEAGHEVTGTYSYASGKSTGGKLVNDGDVVTATLTSADGRTAYPVTVNNGTIVASLSQGEYTLKLSSKLFCDVTKSIRASDADTAIGDVQFTVPKLYDETGNGFMYTQDGVVIPAGNKLHRPFAGTGTATEGFTVSYTMATGENANGWISGGFCFRIGTVWYSMLVYPNKNDAANARIFLTSGINNKFTNGFYLNTYKALDGGDQLITVEIAYYDSAFYIRINGDYAVRIGKELFGSDRPCDGKNDKTCPVYLTDPQYEIFADPESMSEPSKDPYGTIDVEAFFGAGDRVLGLRAVDFTNTFTNVRYTLGNDAARALVRDMRTTAQGMEKQPCAENAWPTV